jgi:hypothetical protein
MLVWALAGQWLLRGGTVSKWSFELRPAVLRVGRGCHAGLISHACTPGKSCIEQLSAVTSTLRRLWGCTRAVRALGSAQVRASWGGSRLHSGADARTGPTVRSGSAYARLLSVRQHSPCCC